MIKHVIMFMSDYREEIQEVVVEIGESGLLKRYRIQTLVVSSI